MFKKIRKTLKLALTAAAFASISFAADISLITGPMFSGKSKHLIETVSGFREGGGVPILMSFVETPIIKSRAYPDREMTPNILFGKEGVDLYGALSFLVGERRDAAIFVDECHFMRREEAADTIRFARERGIKLNFHGLNMDYLTNVWPAICAIRDEVGDLTETTLATGCSICKIEGASGLRALYTARYSKSDRKRCVKGEQIVIDGDRDYVYKPVCYEHLWDDFPVVRVGRPPLGRYMSCRVIRPEDIVRRGSEDK